MYAEAQIVGIITSIEAEAIAILKAVSYCLSENWRQIQLETDSLGIKRMIRGEWKIPWTLKEIIEEIR